MRRAAPTLAAGILATVYVIVSPPSLDLAAHLFRAKLFRSEGFGIWDNWWYAGHNVPGYSVLFPPLAAATSPQFIAALSAVATAAVFESLVWRRFGPDAWLGALWFGLATAVDLFTGRLTFAFGLLPAVACTLALQRGVPRLAVALAFLTALASPVAALFAALAGAAYAVDRYIAERRLGAVIPGILVAGGALVPVGLLAIAFPEGGSEPFGFMTLWPIPLIAVVILLVFPRRDRTLRAGAVLYVLGCLAAFAVPSPVGSNAARLAPMVAGPVLALGLWPRRKLLLLVLAIPLLYIQWQAPVRDVTTAAGDPSASATYWQPVLGFLARQGGPPFRTEIPFTQFHFEVYEVAPRFSLARGWERQFDIADNAIFYNGTLSASTYEAWLHRMAVRFVAVSDAPLDYSAIKEKALIDKGLPYLRRVMRSRHWRVYAVQDATPIVTGAAVLERLGPNWLSLRATRAGTAVVRVRFSPYWALTRGCVAPDGDFTRLTLPRAGPVRMSIRSRLPGLPRARRAAPRRPGGPPSGESTRSAASMPDWPCGDIFVTSVRGSCRTAVDVIRQIVSSPRRVHALRPDPRGRLQQRVSPRLQAVRRRDEDHRSRTRAARIRRAEHPGLGGEHALADRLRRLDLSERALRGHDRRPAVHLPAARRCPSTRSATRS